MKTLPCTSASRWPFTLKRLLLRNRSPAVRPAGYLEVPSEKPSLNSFDGGSFTACGLHGRPKVQAAGSLGTATMERRPDSGYEDGRAGGAVVDLVQRP